MYIAIFLKPQCLVEIGHVCITGKPFHECNYDFQNTICHFYLLFIAEKGDSSNDDECTETDSMKLKIEGMHMCLNDNNFKTCLFVPIYLCKMILY